MSKKAIAAPTTYYVCIYAFPDGPVFAGEGSPVQQLKAFAFVEALSRELGRPINLDDIDDLNIS